MNDHPETAGPSAPAKRSSVANLVRWAVRITSVPMLALALIFLVPVLSHFSVSARDDKIIALALCGTSLGLVLGWRFASLGGGVVLVSVAAMLTQGEGWLSPDPFTVAFGLQGVLFLTSAMLNWRADKPVESSLGWPQKAGVVALVLCALAGAAMIFRGPGPMPVPKDREAFIGVWENEDGLTVEISADGHATISAGKQAKPAVSKGGAPVEPTGRFLAYFRAEDRLELTTGPLGSSKVYQIDRPPFMRNKRVAMVLNGTDPYRREGGMVFVKK